MKRILDTRVGAGIGFVALVVFAAVPAIVLVSPHNTTSAYFATIAGGGITVAWFSAKACSRSPWLAVLSTAVATSLFVVGEAFRSAGLDVLARGPLPWWSENVMGDCVLLGLPVAVAVSALSYALCRWGAKP